MASFAAASFATDAFDAGAFDFDVIPGAAGVAIWHHRMTHRVVR